MSAQPATGDLFAGPLGAELARRVIEATRAARELLGAPPADERSPDPEALPALIAVLGGLPGGAGEELDAHERALERLRGRYESRAEAIERVHAATQGLRRIGSPAELLERVPRALVESSGLDRVVLSIVRSGAMHVEAVHVRGDPPAAAAALARLRETPVRLLAPLIEAEILRRRRATVVSGAQLGDRAHRPLAAVMAWESYVAAAVIVRGSAVALIHADRGRARDVDALDRDVLWEFADGVAQAYDSASLTRALAEEREQMRRLLDWLGARASELGEVSIDAGDEQPPPALVGSEPSAADPPDDRAVFAELLSRRELDVLRLLVGGRSNRAIGAELVLSAGTVKFHVNRILRKLGAANRTEAVARYLTLTGSREI